MPFIHNHSSPGVNGNSTGASQGVDGGATSPSSTTSSSKSESTSSAGVGGPKSPRLSRC